MTLEQQLVWVREGSEGFVLARLHELLGEEADVVPLDSKHARRVANFDDILPAGDPDKEVDDNCELMFLNEATLLNNIICRYKKKKIYTYVANILLAVNPYEDIPDLYSSATIKKYQGRSLGELPPHVFAIADKAFRDMKSFKQSQSIIVSGESGAGKTESTKYILKYLCDLWAKGAGPVEQKILDANPILEAFGNAKTTRNNNSSRFGKFMEVHFSAKYQVVGGHISHYLLEKSRICTQSAEERNYHVFYLLCAGAPQELRAALKITKPDDYQYLKNGCTQYFTSAGSEKKISASQKSKQQAAKGGLRDPILDDVEDFQRLHQALSRVGLTEEEKRSVYSVVAAVLHLGNVEFEEDGGARGGCSVAQHSEPALAAAAHLLGVDAAELRMALVSRLMQSSRGGLKGTAIMVPLKPYEAMNARDALAKAVYSKLFDYIVHRINASIPFQASAYYIGVLDIAGFEYFQMNSFEQFCINYCNEKLQQFFNERILKNEQDLYKREGLNVPEIRFVDNQDCIDLIESKNHGIFHLLDEESKLPKPEFGHFTHSVHKQLGGNATSSRLQVPRSSRLKAHRILRDDEGFLLRHFAGAVCYNTNQFIEKNNDALHASLEFLVQESSCSLVQQLFLTSDNNNAKGKLNFISVGAKFQAQLSQLMDKLKENAIVHSFGLSDKDYKFGVTRLFFRPGKYSEFDTIMRSDPDNLKAIVDSVLAWLVKSRWRRSIFAALSVIKLKNKILYRRECLLLLQKTIRGYLVRRQHRPRYQGIAKIKAIEDSLKKMESVTAQLNKEKETAKKNIENLRNSIRNACALIKSNEKISRTEIDQLYNKLSKDAESQMAALQKAMTDQKNREEQERLRKIEAEMRAAEEAKMKEQERIQQEEEHRRLKAEMESRRKAEEAARLQQEQRDRAAAAQLQRQLEQAAQADLENRDRLEQERRDHEMAMRLAEETNGHVEGSPPQLRSFPTMDTMNGENKLNRSERVRMQQAMAGKQKYDLSKWKYSELRDTINTSCDIELLEACRHEFHRRLKVYHAWKAKNARKTTMHEQERAPQSIMDAAKAPRVSGREVLGARHRYFRIPFVRPGGGERRGWWYAHFDGRYVARQMELHPDKTPVLLQAGIDDMQMCELSLEETGLTRKRGAEILEHEFEREWARHNGPPYRALDRISAFKCAFTGSYVVHWLGGPTIIDREIKPNKETIDIYCYSGCNKNLFVLWQTVKFNLKIKNDEFNQYIGENPEDVYKDYNENSYGWAVVNPFQKKSYKSISIDLFTPTCMAIDTKHRHSIELHIQRVDMWRVLLMALGLVLIFSSKALSGNPVFFYVCGVLVGVSASFLLLVYYFSKLLSRKTLTYGILIGGWTVGVYLIRQAWENVQSILMSYQVYMFYYTLIVTFVSFVVCYRIGPPKNQRSKNLVMWTLQVIGAIMIFFSSQYREASTMVCVLALCIKYFPQTWLYRVQAYWRRKFPPQRRLLTSEEYYEEGARETKRALDNLRQYCSSPDCKQWSVIMKISDAKRFASFVEGNSHLSDDEVMDYESYAFSLERDKPVANSTRAYDISDDDSSTDDEDYL
ncbi:Myosin-VI [Papilio machaon]|uniref:Myosin-VI n=1 Tax=Papilio machaon TaxID=76193 RepID=A0A194QKR1_PAPMA|nr:Myosin-VI [Papilio machaon]